MIVKRLAVPLINEKILQQAVHCFIATSAISAAGFDFIRTRIPPKCKMDVVTGLDELSSPDVLKRIQQHYSGRIDLRIYTRNTLHANVFIFELPFRKLVAFVGSGGMSMAGIKDNEELFWKVTDPKDIESLLSWFTSYFQFGVPLTERLINDYEELYPVLRRRQLEMQSDMDLFIDPAGVNDLQSVKFKNQFFKKEDFELFLVHNVWSQNPVLNMKRSELASKVGALRDRVLDSKPFDRKKRITSTLSDLGIHYPDAKTEAIYFSVAKEIDSQGSGFFGIEVGISVAHVFVRMAVRGGKTFKANRAALNNRLDLEDFRTHLFAAIQKLGTDYTLDVDGVKEPMAKFGTISLIVDFMRTDTGMDFPIVFERRFAPHDPLISEEKITDTLTLELRKLEVFLDLFDMEKMSMS